MDEYDGEEFETKEPLLLFSIGRSYCRIGNACDAVRYAWRVNRSRVERYKLVLANFRGMIVGAYRPAEWLPATKDNFFDLLEVYPDFYSEAPDRWGFVGECAEADVRDYNVGKRVPERYRGSQIPHRYCDP